MTEDTSSASQVSLVLFTESTLNGKGRIIKVTPPPSTASAVELQTALLNAIDPKGKLNASGRYLIKKLTAEGVEASSAQNMPLVESSEDVVENLKIVICSTGSTKSGVSTPAPEGEGVVGAKHTRPSSAAAEVLAGDNKEQSSTGGGVGGGEENDLLSKKRKRVTVTMDDESYQAIETEKLVAGNKKKEVHTSSKNTTQDGSSEWYPMHPMVVEEEGAAGEGKEQRGREQSPETYLRMLEDQLKNRNGGKLTPDQVPGLEQIMDPTGALRNVDERSTAGNGGGAKGGGFDRRELVATRHDNNRHASRNQGGGGGGGGAGQPPAINNGAKVRVLASWRSEPKAGKDGVVLKHITCDICDTPGHEKSKCPRAHLRCDHCHSRGHIQDYCYDFVHHVPCAFCKQLGHNEHRCPVKNPTYMTNLTKSAATGGGGGGSGKGGVIERTYRTGCSHCLSVSHKTEECPQGRKGRLDGQQQKHRLPKDMASAICNGCKKRGHHMSLCPDAKCYKCGAKGHMSSMCTANTSTSEQLCKNCKKPGHLQKNCPEMKCVYCHEMGHMAFVCPKKDRASKRSGGGGGGSNNNNRSNNDLPKRRFGEM